MNKRVDFDDFSSNYNALLHQQTNFFSDSDEYFARYKVELMKFRLTHPVKRILEYGCGIGRNIPYIKEHFPQAEIIGTDISSKSLDIARKDHPEIEFVAEDVGGLDLGKFDLIFVAGVYHHVPADVRMQVTNTLFQRLNVSGSLFVFEHNPYNPVTRRIVSTCPYDDDAVLLRPKELMEYLKKAGFTSPRKEYCLFIPPKFKSLVWVEPCLRWLPLGGQYFVQVSK